MTGRRAVCLIVLILLPAGCSRDNRVHKDASQSTLGDTPVWVDRTALGKRLWEIERQFYEARGYLPAWIDGDRTTPQLKVLIEQFRYSEVHGLDPAAYPVEQYER